MHDYALSLGHYPYRRGKLNHTSHLPSRLVTAHFVAVTGAAVDPLSQGGLDTKKEEKLGGKEGGEERAIRILESEHNARRRAGPVKVQTPHPSRELHDPKAAIRGVLLEQLIMDRCGGVGYRVPSDSCGNTIYE